MSLSERLAALLSTEEETPEEEEEVKDKGVEKAAKADKPADKKQADKPKKLVWKQITLGCKPINVNLSKEVERFNK